jgi:hypothetical protein
MRSNRRTRREIAGGRRCRRAPASARRGPSRAAAAVINLAAVLVVAPTLSATLVFSRTPAAASSAPSRCFPRGARVILKDHVAAVADTGDGLVACDFGVRNPQLLDSPIDTVFAFRGPSLVLNGTYLGFAVDDCDYQKPTCETQVAQINLAERGGAGPTGFPAQPTGKPYAKVGSLRVGRRGDLIWIVCPDRGQDPGFLFGKQTPNCVRPGDRDTVITLAAGTKSEVILDSGRRIDPSSLRLSGTVASWSHSGRRRHARLS